MASLVTHSPMRAEGARRPRSIQRRPKQRRQPRLLSSSGWHRRSFCSPDISTTGWRCCAPYLAPSDYRCLGRLSRRGSRSSGIDSCSSCAIQIQKRDESQISAIDLTRIDLCWSAVAGLSMSEPIRGADFQSRGLLLALRAGEPRRIARALAMEAGHRATAGAPAGPHVAAFCRGPNESRTRSSRRTPEA